MAVYPSSTRIYLSSGVTTPEAVWEDITDRVTSTLDADMGMADESYETRSADPGYLTLWLDNADGRYTPSTNFGKGSKLKVEVTYQGMTQIKFFGHIDEAEIDSGTSGDQFTRVTAVDWLDYPLRQLVRERAVQTDKRMDEGIETLLTDVPIQPEETLIDEGSTIFPTIFDQVDRDTSVYREMNNLVLSEYGYMYMDRGGQRLRVENRAARSGIPVVQTLPATNSNSFLKLAGQDGYLRLIGGGRLQLNSSASAIISGSFAAESDNPLVKHGKHVVNDVEFIVYPKDVDASNVVLFTLEEPIFIPELGTKTFTAFYSDPNSGQQIGGTNLVPLVTGTGYQAFEYQTASGSNYTTNLTISSVEKVNAVIYTVTNSGAGAWITSLVQLGRGIYPRNPLNTIATSDLSKERYGITTLSIRQPYQQTLELGEEEAAKILDIEREPRNVLVRAKLNANASDFNMNCFMHLDIGSLIRIINPKSATDSNYFIQGMKWKIEKGGAIDVTYRLKEMPTFAPMAIEFNGHAVGSQNGIDYGTPDVLDNIEKVSYVIKINLRNPAVGAYPLMGKYTSIAQKVFIAFDTGHLRFVQDWTLGAGQWVTQVPHLTGTSSLDRWITLGVTYDGSLYGNQPTFYISGSPVAITQEVIPSGTMTDDSLARFIVGNAAYSGVAEWIYRPVFTWKDARVYNRIISATEMAEINADENNYDTVPDGLIFQASFVRNFRYAATVNTPMGVQYSRAFDRVNSLAGVPHYTAVTGTYEIYRRDPTLSSY